MGVEKLLVTLGCRNRDKLRRDGPVGAYADFVIIYLFIRLEDRPTRIEMVATFRFTSFFLSLSQFVFWISFQACFKFVIYSNGGKGSLT